mgnify:CR=1 FL=1
MLEKLGIDTELENLSKEVEKEIKNQFKTMDEICEKNSMKVLSAFQECNLQEMHLNSSTGYGIDEAGRNKIEEIYANVFKAEDALVRAQFISGTHALAITLSALLRPNDTMISITGEPYDTLQTVIGCNETESKSSLKAFGIKYEQIELVENDFDIKSIQERLKKQDVKLVEIQRSRGYSTRKSLTIEKIEKAIKAIREVNKDVIIMVDNCYGEFVQDKEPIEIGADIAVGSLMKNLGAGIATSGEASSQFHKLENVGTTELATMSFGQRFTITPLQMITAASAIANNGVLVQPRIVKSIENPDTGAVTNIDVKEVRQVISSETATKVRSMMQSVVTDGGGKYGSVKGYAIGGKTGTSEPDPNHPEDGYVVSFLAIAPVENTKVVALLVLYGPQVKNYYGGAIAAPVVSQVLSEVLPYLGIPSNDTSEVTTNNSLITIPDLRNKTVSEAKQILKNLGITPVTSASDNEIVTVQTPKAGVSVSKNGVCKLYTEENSTSVSVTVPDLKGKSLSNVTATLKSKNLNIQSTGSGIVVSQDPAVGSTVEEGTVVKVTLQEVASDLH